MDDKELTRLAQEEIQQEAFRAKSRAESMGALGWQRCPLPSTNKRFLQNVVISTLEPWKKAKQVNSADKDEDTNRRSSSPKLQQEHSKPQLKSSSSSNKRSSSKDRHQHKRKHKEKKTAREHKEKSKLRRNKKERR